MSKQGEFSTLPDVDGNLYPVVQIHGQRWLGSNLMVTRFRNNDAIPVVSNEEDWERLGDRGLPACCYYRNDEAQGRYVGMLYNGFAVSDPRALAPVGCKVPSIEDWNVLIGNCGHSHLAGLFLKSASGWNFGGNGKDRYGFSALPGGGRGIFGAFLDLGDYGNWWCDQKPSDPSGAFVYMSFINGLCQVRKDGFRMSGFSVRCVLQ